ncbi:MAG: putative photosynthetic complex assembly protein PuhE [Pseudomonadota bacterium]
MGSTWIAILFALFVWWFATGLILMAVKYCDRLGGDAHRMSVIATLPVLVLGCWAFIETLYTTGAWGSYIAFLSSITIWGWFELAFLAGVLTGPVTRHCPPDTPAWERFVRAWGTVAYSEMALVAVLCAMVLAMGHASNTVGVWTFIILYFARVSAKLNLHFGVPYINLEFIPDRLTYLNSHFRVGAVSRLFPVSITFLTLALACWMERLYWSENGSAEAVGFALLASLTALALLEHWLMVIPVGDAKLWRWMVAHLKPSEQRKREDRINAVSPASMRENAHGL